MHFMRYCVIWGFIFIVQLNICMNIKAMNDAQEDLFAGLLYNEAQRLLGMHPVLYNAQKTEAFIKFYPPDSFESVLKANLNNNFTYKNNTVYDKNTEKIVQDPLFDFNITSLLGENVLAQSKKLSVNIVQALLQMKIKKSEDTGSWTPTDNRKIIITLSKNNSDYTLEVTQRISYDIKGLENWLLNDQG